MPILPTFEAESKSSIMTKENKYQTLLPQIKALIEGEDDIVSLMANTAAALREEMSFFWVGFYVVHGNELHLGPFQGSVACYRIPYGKGVCGTAWQRGETIIVDDVEKFPGHIACSSLSRSEIVVPVKNASGEVTAVLDIDSTELSSFDATDRHWLEMITALLGS